MRLQVFVQNNERQMSFDTRQSGRRDIILRNATILWKFKNIKKNFNDTITDDSGTKLDILAEGYYSFEDLQKKFMSNNITLELNSYDNTCSITSTGNSVKLGNLGVMLGFVKDHTFTQNVESDGTSPVDVHHNLRFVKLSADIADKSDVCLEGKRSQVFATLPVESQQRLFSTRTVYSDLDIRIPIVINFRTINFSLGTNSDWKYIEINALLDLDIV